MADSGNKPPFDPSKPFASADEKPEFDPSKPFQAADDSQPGFLAQAGKATVNALPMIGGVVGGIVGTPADLIAGPMGNVAGAAAGGALGASAKNAINSYISPSDAPKTLTDNAKDIATQGLIQGATQGAGELAAPLVSKAVGAVSEPFSNWLAKGAEKSMVKSTGATGREVYNNFPPDTGRRLLDMGMAGFGRSQAKVAQKIAEASEAAGKTIGDTVDSLSAKGATVDEADVIDSIRQRAQALSQRSETFRVADQLNKTADRMQGVIEANGGNSEVPLNIAEKSKRMYQDPANYNGAHASDIMHDKEMASIYRQAVEDAATQFDPAAAKTFQAAKRTFGALNPVAEAAAKRAATVQQSPDAGFMDMASTAAGANIGGAAGSIALPFARRAVATRIAPTMAAGKDLASKAVKAVPGLINRGVPAASDVVLPGLLTPAYGKAKSNGQ
jgi:hypothetical protein